MTATYAEATPKTNRWRVISAAARLIKQRSLKSTWRSTRVSSYFTRVCGTRLHVFIVFISIRQKFCDATVVGSLAPHQLFTCFTSAVHLYILCTFMTDVYLVEKGFRAAAKMSIFVRKLSTLQTFCFYFYLTFIYLFFLKRISTPYYLLFDWLTTIGYRFLSFIYCTIQLYIL